MINKEACVVRKFYSGKPVEKLDELFEKAATGGGQEKYDLAIEMLQMNSLYFAPSNVEINRQALEVFEEAAREGHVKSMEAAISIHARGIANSKTESSDNGGMIVMVETPRPDFNKAKEWCEKAIAAGSTWAVGVLPHLEADIAKQKAQSPQQSGPSPG